MQATAPIRIGIVCGKKAPDALLCESLEKHFPNPVICQYQIPPEMWLSWLFKRIKELGVAAVLGHVCLSTALRLHRLIERVIKKPLWLRYCAESPSWRRLHAKPRFYFSEDKLIAALQDVDIIILLDSFRLTHTFYRAFNVPILQIVWGALPGYAGDSGAFWAYALGDIKNIGATIVRRGSDYSSLTPITFVPITVDETKNLRTIKIKQALAMARELPNTIGMSKNTVPDKKERNLDGCVFRAPTLFTYLRFLANRTLTRLPAYSFTKIIFK